MSYGSLTEITRNPRNSRGSIEKNWMMFGSQTLGSYVHYDMTPSKRSFAKILGGGLTTVNLTDPFEQPCLDPSSSEEGSWHQGTNSLLVTLCDRVDEGCIAMPQNQVFFGIVHHKHKNMFSLPLRYERYVIVWSAEPPFSMLGVSKHPVLFYNETANGFKPEENWYDDEEQQALLDQGHEGKSNWAWFTYTVSIAWAWGRTMDEPHEKNTGYLDDELIVGIGVDDRDMVYTQIVAGDLLKCLQSCPGRSDKPLAQEGDVILGDRRVPGFRLSEEKAEDEEQEKSDAVEKIKSQAMAAEEMQATKTPTMTEAENQAQSAIDAMRTAMAEEEGVFEEIVEEIVEEVDVEGV